jgi:RNA polymerase sigma-70 factor (ECF subfamily)
MKADGSRTSPTLLQRLRRSPADPEAWREFVRRYGAQIFRWCRQWHLQDADADDVTQTVLLKLAEKMKEFQYEPSGSFRAWLKTVAHHAYRKFVASRHSPGQGSGDSRIQGLLESVEARDDLVTRLEEEFDRELLEQATVRVRLRVEPRTWAAFCLRTLDGLSGAEAAKRLDMKVTTVYVATFKVQRMLREEMQKLEAGS